MSNILLYRDGQSDGKALVEIIHTTRIALQRRQGQGLFLEGSTAAFKNPFSSPTGNAMDKLKWKTYRATKKYSLKKIMLQRKQANAGELK